MVHLKIVKYFAHINLFFLVSKVSDLEFKFTTTSISS